MSEEIESISDAAAEPKSVAIDGVRVEQHGISDRVAAARFAKESAAGDDPFASLRHRQLRITGER